MTIYFPPQLKTTFSTDSRVQNMFDILLSDEADKDKKEKVGNEFLCPLCLPLNDLFEIMAGLFQAANNLIVLAREDAGAERIFQNNGVALLMQLIETGNGEMIMAAIRTFSGMCTGHRARVSKNTTLLDHLLIDSSLMRRNTTF